MPLTITHAKSNTIADFTGTVTVNNSSGGTGTVLATNLVRPSDWNSGHNVTLSLAASEVASLFTVSGELSMSTNTSGVTIYEPLVAQSYYEPFPLGNAASTMMTGAAGSWYLSPFNVPEAIGSGHLKLFMSQGVSSAIFQNGAVFTTNSTGSVTRYQTLSNKFVIYRPGTGASSTRLETVATAEVNFYGTQEMRVTSSTNSTITISHYMSVSFPYAVDSTGGQSYSSTTASGTQGSSTTTTIAASAGSATIASARNYLTGPFMVPVPLTTSLSAGQYWIGRMISSTSSTTGTNYGAGTIFSTHSHAGLLDYNFNIFKAAGQTVSNTSSQPFPFLGVVATTSTGPISTLGTSDIRSTTGRLYFNHVAGSTA